MGSAFTGKQSTFPLAGKALYAKLILRTEHPCAISNTRGEAVSAERGNFKNALRAAGLHITHGRKGGPWGESEVSPHAPCAVRSPENKAHSLWLAKHFTHSRCRGQCQYGRVRTGTDGYGGVAHGILGDMCLGISVAHGCVAEHPCAISNTRGEAVSAERAGGG